MFCTKLSWIINVKRPKNENKNGKGDTKTPLTFLSNSQITIDMSEFSGKHVCLCVGVKCLQTIALLIYFITHFTR